VSDPNVNDKEARSVANCMALHPASHDDPVDFHRLLGFNLIYRPRNVRATTPCGFSPVEQVFTTVNIGLRRELFLLDYYTEGNIPDALIGVPETWTPDQIASYQRWWDDYNSGNLSNRRRARFVPGTIAKSYTQTKEPELSGQFDEWLGKIVCFAFSIPPNWFTKQMSNRSGAKTTKEAAEEEGLAPILEWAKQLFDDVPMFWSSSSICRASNSLGKKKRRLTNRFNRQFLSAMSAPAFRQGTKPGTFLALTPTPIPRPTN
jgi:hypothetical protein